MNYKPSHLVQHKILFPVTPAGYCGNQKNIKQPTHDEI